MTKFKKLLKAFACTFLIMFSAFLLSLGITIFAKFFPIVAVVGGIAIFITAFFAIAYNIYIEWDN